MDKIVRTFVVALTLTGIAAAAATSAKPVSRPTPRPDGSFPIPTCPPNDPNACGMGR